jgi:hypothetical protein
MLNSSAAWQLAWALATVLVIYVLASTAKRTVAIGAVLVMIPFQTVETQYASSSVLVAYATAALLLLNGGLRVRMLPALGLIVLAYLISLSQSDRSLLSLHMIYLFQFFSCLVVFLLAYNFARLVESERTVIDILLLMNVIVIPYFGLQMLAGPGETFVPFGIQELAFNRNREINDPRLVGPFGNPGSTSGYLTLMVLICAVELMFASGRRRYLIQTLVVFNLMGLVATGNRAGFLVLLVMFPILLLVFRDRLGARRVSQYLIGGAAVLAVASAVAVSYTGFGQLFQRMETVTETEDGIPLTRANTWGESLAKIEKFGPDSWVGEGPFFVYPGVAEKLGWLPSEMSPYPHSLYLYLLRTVGIIGLFAVVGFFLRAWILLYRAHRRGGLADYPAAIVRLGLVLIPAFLTAQITLEFNRTETMDYAQFIFALLGMMIGVSDRVGAVSTVSTAEAPRKPGARDAAISGGSLTSRS